MEYFNYSFGVPATWVWSLHILIGIYFIYLGHLLSFLPENIRLHSQIMFSIGALMTLYHSHIWKYQYDKKLEKKTNED